MIYLLPEDEIIFPHPEDADPSGILAIGGDLSPQRLLLAYRHGIFPWFSDDEPITWYSPPERFVLFPAELKLSKSTLQFQRKSPFHITYNQAFSKVIAACKSIQRPGQDGTWITDEMEAAYTQLHHQGIARSVEVWHNDELCGGLYGIHLQQVFCGESMFSFQSNASKMAFIHLVQSGAYQLIDCQVPTAHLASMGARSIPRSQFLELLQKYQGQ